MIAGLVSTVIPVYNRSDLLVEAVKSVLAQTYRPIEILIVDDGSTDATPQVARELAAKNPEIVRFIQQANEGPGRARQTGLEASRGEFIQYLDSDDLLLPRSLSCRWLHLGHGQIVPSRMARRDITRSARRHATCLLSGPASAFPPYCRRRCSRAGGAPQRRSIAGPSSIAPAPGPSLRNEEDWEYDCRIGALGTRLAYCDAFVSDTRYHDGDQLSRDGSSDPTKLRDRAEAHRLIYGHARRAGISDVIPEMRHFARELFLLARQCGSAGLGDDARMLFGLARDASGATRGRGLDFRLYNATAKLLGWTMAGRLACRLDRVRSEIVMLPRR